MKKPTKRSEQTRRTWEDADARRKAMSERVCAWWAARPMRRLIQAEWARNLVLPPKSARQIAQIRKLGKRIRMAEQRLAIEKLSRDSWTDERRAAQTIANADINTPQHREKLSRIMSERNRRQYKETGIERKVREWLEASGIPFQVQAKISSMTVDFLIGTTVVECDGDYWHSLTGKGERDAARDRQLLRLKYRIVRLRESDINRNWSKVEKKLRKVIERGQK